MKCTVCGVEKSESNLYYTDRGRTCVHCTHEVADVPMGPSWLGMVTWALGASLVFTSCSARTWSTGVRPGPFALSHVTYGPDVLKLPFSMIALGMCGAALVTLVLARRTPAQTLFCASLLAIGASYDAVTLWWSLPSLAWFGL